MTAVAELPQVDTPWMRLDECAAYLEFRSVKTFRNWLCTKQGRKLPRSYVGSSPRFNRFAVDRFMVEQGRVVRRHGRSVKETEHVG